MAKQVKHRLEDMEKVKGQHKYWYKPKESLSIWYTYDKNGIFRRCSSGRTTDLQREQQKMAAALRDLVGDFAAVRRAVKYVYPGLARFMEDVEADWNDKIKREYQWHKRLIIEAAAAKDQPK